MSGSRPSRLTDPIVAFLRTEAGGGAVLLAAAVIALVWANSPASAAYESFWHTEVPILDRVGDLRHVVNDGLMTLFFFVVGLEIKREFVAGELNDTRKAMLPIVGAIGGMIGPALLYLAFNAGGVGANGWGIPMATDIAFAVGVLALMSPRVPPGLKIFLLTLAIVDDIGAIVVIAVFYTGGIEPLWLLGATAAIAVVVGMRLAGVGWVSLYVAAAAALWFSTLESGVHATIAGVVLGLLTPARRVDAATPSAAERIGSRLHPWTSFVVIPMFALANAGLRLGEGSLGSRVSMGIVAGLVAGKLLGISGASWIAVRVGLARLPAGVGWADIVAGAAVGGIGFTVSLFITDLAFVEPGLTADAKLGVMFGSAVAGALGAVLLVRAGGKQDPH